MDESSAHDVPEHERPLSERAQHEHAEHERAEHEHAQREPTDDVPPAEDLPPDASGDDLSPAHGGPVEQPTRPVTVLLDRDPVGAEDDVPHGERWTLPGTVTVTDLVLALVDRRYHAEVDGPAGWLVELGHRTLQADDDGTLHWVGEVRPAAVLHVEHGGVHVTFLRDPREPELLREAAPVEGEEDVVVHLRFLPWARPLAERGLGDLPSLTGARPLEVVREGQEPD